MELDNEDLIEMTRDMNHWQDIDDRGMLYELWQDMDDGEVYTLVRDKSGGTLMRLTKEFIRRTMLNEAFPPLPRAAGRLTARDMRYLLLQDKRRTDKRVYGCYCPDLVNRQSKLDMSHDIQDRLSDMGLIALVNPRLGKKGGNIIGYRILNKYIHLDRYINDISDLDWLHDFMSDKESEVEKANYYCWCKCLGQRPEWLKNARYKLWADRYTLYRLDKLFEG